MSERRTLLHVFSTFNVGGPQMRFVQLANHFGERYRHRIVTMDGATAAMTRLLPQLDAKIIAVPTRKGETLNNIRAFRRTLMELRPDLLVTSNWGSIEWAMANCDHAVQHLHMEDGFGQEEAEHQLRRRVWTRRLVLPRSTVMLPSRNLFKIAREIWKLPSRALVYIPNGVDCARFLAAGDWDFANQHGIRRDLPVVGSIGGVRPEKNLFRLLEAFALVLGARPAQLVIVGEGELLAELRRAAEERGLSAHVVFTGASPTPERLLPLFSLFALSSDTEQMPLSVLEAMAASRAIASTNVGDVHDMVAEENRPFVVARDAKALSDAILALLADRPKTAALGRANRERAVALYDQSQMFATYGRLFDGDFATQAERAASAPR